VGVLDDRSSDLLQIQEKFLKIGYQDALIRCAVSGIIQRLRDAIFIWGHLKAWTPFSLRNSRNARFSVNNPNKMGKKI